MSILILYVLAVPLVFLMSLIGMFTASRPETRKTFKTLMLVTLGLMVLGAGLCALIFSNLNLNGMH